MSGNIYISGKSSNNKIAISGSGEKKDIDLSTKETNNNLATQNNNAKYYSDKALDSANKAERQANLAKGYAESVIETKDELLNNEDFKTVVTNIDNINTVGENIENVITIAEDLEGVADNLDVINNVNDNLEVITNVNTNIQDINTVASNIEDIQNAEENANVAKEKAQESADYSELSKQWAISSELVENIDYSSKHYAKVSKEQADISTSKTNEVVEKGNTAISEITNTKNIAISDVETLADNTKTEIQILGNEKVELATVQAEIAITKASEASQSASNALKSAENAVLSEANAKESENNAKASETNAKTSEQNAKSSEQKCQEIYDRLGVVIKLKGRVDTLEDLPTTNVVNGDAYLVGFAGLNSYPEYYWYEDHWEYMGSTEVKLEWGGITGTLSNQTDLQTALDNKADLTSNQTFTGAKTFTQPIKIQNGAGTGSLIIGADVNAGTLTNGTRKLARIAVPTQSNKDLMAILLGFDSNGDNALHIKNKNYDALSYGGQTKITNATSPMAISFCVTKERNSTSASDKVYALEMDANEARFNVQPNYNDVNLATTVDITNALSGYAKLTDIPDVSNFATKTEVSEGLATKQPLGNYALKSEIPDVSNLATKDEIPTDYATKTELQTKQDTLTAGENIDIVDNVISAKGSGHDLFDIVQKDHILNFEETEGYELLGSYVYKEALAGSRYGYPDFYNKVVEEYNNATETKTVKHYQSINVTVVGNLTESKGVIRGFTADNYAQIPIAPPIYGDDWEYCTKIKLSNNAVISPIIATSVNYDGFQLQVNASGVLQFYLSSNGTSWNVANGLTGTTVLETNKDYWVLIKAYSVSNIYHYDVMLSTDGKTYKNEISSTIIGATVYEATTLYNIGKNHSTNIFNGSIDLKETYFTVSSVRIWEASNFLIFNFKEHSNGHKFFDIANKDAIDEYYNATGVAWFYGVDEANERILLPRNDYYFKNGDLASVGNNIEAGLPNITGQIGDDDASDMNLLSAKKELYQSGALIVKARSSSWCGAAAGSDYKIGVIELDASKSNSIYANSDTVQPTSVSVLAYMVVGNVKTTQGYSEVVAQGKEILEQVNEGIANGIETRANLDLSNVTQSSGLRRLIEVSEYNLLPSWYKVFEETNPQTGEVMRWCEQGGKKAEKTAVISFLKPFKNVDYYWNIYCNKTSSAASSYSYYSVKNATDITTLETTEVGYWYACGYIS